MDRAVIEQLTAIGFDVTLEQQLLLVGIELDEQEQVVEVGEEVQVHGGDRMVPVRLRALPELWEGQRRPPEFTGAPPAEYLPFFASIELVVLDFCEFAGQDETDTELERLYRHLRRRPAGRDDNPLFSYLQAACRLYLSLRPVSQAEFEAVAQRLSQSARAQGTHPTSRNYLAHLRRTIKGAG